MMSVLLVVGGCILFMLGLIGEYIGRIYISLNNSPQYVVKKVVTERKNKVRDVKLKDFLILHLVLLIYSGVSLYQKLQLRRQESNSLSVMELWWHVLEYMRYCGSLS